MDAGQSFTITYPGLTRELIAHTGISPAFDPCKLDKTQWPKAVSFRGIWDTGATNTVITEAVVVQCGLQPTGMTKVVGT
jgi:hypothetical protein